MPPHRAPEAIAYTRPSLTTYQRAFTDHPARYVIVEAATKTGKTTACLVWLLEQALRSPAGSTVWWVAPVKQQAQMAWRRTRHMLRGQLAAISHRTDLSITLPGDRQLVYHTAEKPDHLYGEDVQAVVIDEATRCRAEAWHAVRSTLTATTGPARIIGNVRGRKNWVHVLAQNAQNPRLSQYAAFKVTAYQAAAAGVIPYAEIADARASLPEHVFRELYEAEPAEDASNPFSLEALEACTREQASIRPPVVVGIDVAKRSDFTVLVGLDVNGDVCLLNRFQDNWANTERRIRQVVGRTPTLIDSTGNGDALVERLAHDLPNVTGFTFTSRSKQDLMEGLAASLQAHELGIPKGILMDELQVFEYSYENRTLRYQAAQGYHDDAVCALALAVKHWRTHRHRLSFDYFM